MDGSMTDLTDLTDRCTDTFVENLLSDKIKRLPNRSIPIKGYNKTMKSTMRSN